MNNETHTHTLGTPDNVIEDKKGVKTFSQEEVNNIISKRLAEENSKNEARLKELLANERLEAEKMAKMTEDEKKQEEYNTKNQELTNREQNILLREMKLEAIDLLKEKGLSTDFVDFVVNTDINKIKENVNKLATTYNKTIQDSITDKLKGSIPEDYSDNTKIKAERKTISAF